MAEKTISELIASNEVTFKVLNKADSSSIEELIYIRKISKCRDKRMELTVKDLNIIKNYNITEFITELAKEEVEKIYTYCSTVGYIFTLPEDEELMKITNDSSESNIQDLYLNTIKKILRKYALPYFNIIKIEAVINDDALDNISGNSNQPSIYSITFKTGSSTDDLVIHYNSNKTSSTNFSFTEDVGYSMIVEKSINLIYEKYKKIANDKADQLERTLAILTSKR